MGAHDGAGHQRRIEEHDHEIIDEVEQSDEIVVLQEEQIEEIIESKKETKGGLYINGKVLHKEVLKRLK